MSDKFLDDRRTHRTDIEECRTKFKTTVVLNIVLNELIKFMAGHIKFKQFH